MQDLMKRNYRSDFGDVIVVTTFSQRIIILCSFIIFIIVVLFMYFSNYTQKINIHGIVYPDKGIVSIKSKQSGVLSALYKKNGESVRLDEKLFAVDASSSTYFFRNNEENYWRMFLKLKNLNDKEAQVDIKTLDSKKKLTEEQIAQTINSIEIMEGQIRLLDAAIKSHEESFNKIQNAYKKKYVSNVDKNNAEILLIDKKIQRQSLYNEIISQKGQVINLNKELDDIENRIKDIQSDNEKERVQSLMKMYGIASETESIVHASVAGKVAEVIERTGEGVNSGDTIMTIIPQGSTNQIVAFISPELVGEIKKGTRVALKYDSYPYQRFGVEHGTISDISTVPLHPEDIYANFGLKLEKASFRVEIKITDHKKKINIIPGMSLEVEIPTRKTSIIKWVFPFFRDKNTDL